MKCQHQGASALMTLIREHKQGYTMQHIDREKGKKAWQGYKR